MARLFTQYLRHYEDWNALSTINAYRGLIAVGLLGAQSIPVLQAIVTITQPALFNTAVLLYLLSSVAAVICTTLRQPRIRTQATVFITLDIVFLALIMFAGTGVVGGLGALLIVFVGFAGALLDMRYAAFMAALATLATLAQEALRPLIVTGAQSALFQAGLLSGLFFIMAGLAQWLAQRIRTSQATVAAHAKSLRNLTELNRNIIEQMKMGVVVLDGGRRIQLTNAAAVELLGLAAPPERDTPLDRASTQLAGALDSWLHSPGGSTAAIQPAQRTLLPSFSILSTDSGHNADSDPPILVFLEDASRQSEQAHNLKLAALGRLSAGIAHEIRNPLSAIAHASQLLAESQRLDDDDRRLLDIVQRHSQRIDAIVDDVMGLSRRTDSRQPPLRLKPCVEQIIAEYQQYSDNPAAVSVAGIDAAQSVQFDGDHLRRILLNLWQNAERHARRPGTALAIRLTGNRNGAGTFRLDIVDNGPGIEGAAANRVLEPFYTTGNGGTGLGLHVARELCESNGARLIPVADTGGGRFRIIFSVASNSHDHG